jgi:nitrate/nitrite transporter NarK
VNILRGIYRFLYDFIIGDDWKIAVAVITALTIGLLLLAVGLPTTATVIITAGLVGAAFTIAMLIDVQRSRDGT